MRGFVLILWFALPLWGLGYKVQPGDTWYGISKKFQSDPESLAKNNGKAVSDPLHVGQTLVVPDSEEKPQTAPRKLQDLGITKVKENPIYPISTKKWHKNFSQETHNPHKGILFEKSGPYSVKASLSGKVISIDYMDGYANYLVLDHGEDYFTVYGNLDKILVVEGQMVQKGDRLGAVPLGKGLYFQVNHGKKSTSPLVFLEKGFGNF